MKAVSQPLVRILTGDTFDRCPKAFLAEDCSDVSYLFTAFKNYQRSILPQSGGYDDQSPYFIARLEVIKTAAFQMATVRAEFDKAKAAAKKALLARKGLKVV